MAAPTTKEVLGVKTRPTRIFDALLELKDDYLVATSAAAKVDDTAKILDMGTGVFKADVEIDVTALEIASNDEIYTICIQLSSSSTFASNYVTTAKLELGAAEVLLSDLDSTTGRYIMTFDNEFNGAYYQYARIYTVVAGTITTGINYTAFASKLL